MRKWYRNSHYTIHNADSFEWLRAQRANSFQLSSLLVVKSLMRIRTPSTQSSNTMSPVVSILLSALPTISPSSGAAITKSPLRPGLSL